MAGETNFIVTRANVNVLLLFERIGVLDIDCIVFGCSDEDNDLGFNSVVARRCAYF
jgi:hypothetical protein